MVLKPAEWMPLIRYAVGGIVMAGRAPRRNGNSLSRPYPLFLRVTKPRIGRGSFRADNVEFGIRGWVLSLAVGALWVWFVGPPGCIPRAQSVSAPLDVMPPLRASEPPQTGLVPGSLNPAPRGRHHY